MGKPVSIRWEMATAAAAYAGLAVIFTWPVALSLDRSVAGFEGRDSFQHIWLLWWFREALLSQRQAVAQVDVLYFPQGATHSVLWMHPLTPLLGLPLTVFFGPRLTYNLVLLISFVLTGTVGYLLTRLLVRQRWVAFVGGLIIAFAPHRLGHALAGHLLLVVDFALPLYVLALWLWLKRPSRQLSALYTVSLVLVLLSHPNFVGYFVLIVTPILLVSYWLRGGRISRQRWSQLLLAWLIAGLAYLPFAWPALMELAGGRLAYLQPGDVGEHSADLLSFVAPSPFHPLWKGNPPRLITLVLDGARAMEEGFNYVGLVALILAAIAALRMPAQAAPWVVIAGLAALLSLGPALKLAGHTTLITMPYAWVGQLPFFSWSRTPGRLMSTAMLAIGVLAALGSARVMGWRRGRRFQWVLGVALAGLIVFEYLPGWPFPIDSQSISPYYYQLAQVPAEGGLLDMPVSGSRRASNYAMFYQTVHHRPLVGGYIERDPPGTEELRLFADRLLSPSSFSVEAFMAPTPPERAAILGDMGVTQVVAHPALMTDRAARATLSFMPEVLGEPTYADDDLMAWRVSSGDVSLPPHTLLLAEEGWEPAGEGFTIRLNQEGLLFVYAARPGSVVLSLEANESTIAGTELWVGGLGPFSADAERLRFRIPLQLKRGLNWLPFRLTGCEKCSMEFSRIGVE